MKITINGEDRDIADETNVSALLESMQLDPQRVAVERNRQIVRRANFDQTTLTDGDELEIVTLVGGG